MDHERRRFEFRVPSISEVGVVMFILVLLTIAVEPAVVKHYRQEVDDRKACATNLKVLGLALLEYTQDWDESYPVSYKGAPQAWAGRLLPYTTYAIKGTAMTGMYKCPSDTTTPDASLDPVADIVSYGLNSNLHKDIPGHPNNASSISDLELPSSTVVLFEVSGARVQFTQPYGACDEGTRGYEHRPPSRILSPSGDGLGDGPEWGWRGSGKSPISYAFTRHTGAANYGMADAHVEWLTQDKVSFGRNNSSSTGIADTVRGIAAGTSSMRGRATFSIN